MTVTTVEFGMRSLNASLNYVRWEADTDLSDFSQVRLVRPTETLLSSMLEGVIFRVADLFAEAPDTTL